VHALPFAAINIKANIVLGDRENSFFHSIFNDAVSNSDYTAQGCPTFLKGPTIYKCGCRLHNTTWWSTHCRLDTPYIVSIGWMREFSEVERIWKQMWHNLIQHPSMCLKKFRKTRM